MTFTRKQYLDAARDDRSAHRRYYGQFVTPRTIEHIVRAVGADVIRASTDPHFNDIPLQRWDALRPSFDVAKFKEANGGTANLSLSDFVCISKEAAQQFRERANPA